MNNARPVFAVRAGSGFGLENMRCKWRKWLYFDCNWKVALEAFIDKWKAASIDSPGTEIYKLERTHN